MTKTQLNIAMGCVAALTALTVYLWPRKQAQAESAPVEKPLAQETPSQDEAAAARKARMRELGKQSAAKRKAKKAAAIENGGV